MSSIIDSLNIPDSFTNSLRVEPIIPATMKIDPSLFEEPKHAKFQHKILMEYIADFEAKLNPDQEVALKLACFGQSIVMNVTYIGYHNPSIIQFCGYVNGQYSELIQHVSQLNFLLMSAPKQEPDKPARRIGFTSEDD